MSTYERAFHSEEQEGDPLGSFEFAFQEDNAGGSLEHGSGGRGSTAGQRGNESDMF